MKRSIKCDQCAHCLGWEEPSNLEYEDGYYYCNEGTLAIRCTAIARITASNLYVIHDGVYYVCAEFAFDEESDFYLDKCPYFQDKDCVIDKTRIDLSRYREVCDGR